MEQGFYWHKNSDDCIVLGYEDDAAFPKSMQCLVDPAHGSNLCRMTVDGHHVIDYDNALLKKGDYTGTPVLYPTPNRVRNGVFSFEGVLFQQTKRGVSVLEHGLVHDEPWAYAPPQITGKEIKLESSIRFDKKSALFEAFPFHHVLRLTFILSSGMLCIRYCIENSGDCRIPFGFGLHPYFMKLSGDDDTLVSLPAQYVMDATCDLLPTGRLIDVENTIYDLRKPVEIGILDFDHVFSGIEANASAGITYKSLGLHVKIESTPDFSHLVLYSPRGENYFCLESQTCSTDAHNLYNRAFIKESGLKIVEPGATWTGQVYYKISGV
jgi:aldose 1-epimerase